jgi:hypothetical protein
LHAQCGKRAGFARAASRSREYRTAGRKTLRHPRARPWFHGTNGLPAGSTFAGSARAHLSDAISLTSCMISPDGGALRSGPGARKDNHANGRCAECEPSRRCVAEHARSESVETPTAKKRGDRGLRAPDEQGAAIGRIAEDQRPRDRTQTTPPEPDNPVTEGRSGFRRW